MSNLKLEIENEVIYFWIEEAKAYPFIVKGEQYLLDVYDVHEKGCCFRTGKTSGSCYWWDAETKPLLICANCENLYEENHSKGRLEDRIREKHICFSCAFWDEKADGENPLVIDGVRYSLGTGGGNGMGGRKFVIEYFTGETVETRDLWSQGQVPEWIRDRIPDTAKFLDGAYFDREAKAWQSSQ